VRGPDETKKWRGRGQGHIEIGAVYRCVVRSVPGTYHIIGAAKHTARNSQHGKITVGKVDNGGVRGTGAQHGEHHGAQNNFFRTNCYNFPKINDGSCNAALPKSIIFITPSVYCLFL
jgi:hypothetical protein